MPMRSSSSLPLAHGSACSARIAPEKRPGDLLYGEPAQPQRLGVKHELQGDADNDQCGGHRERTDGDFARYSNRLSAVPKDEWAIERNPVCTAIRIAMQAQKAAATDIAEIERASHTC